LLHLVFAKLPELESVATESSAHLLENEIGGTLLLLLGRTARSPPHHALFQEASVHNFNASSEADTATSVNSLSFLFDLFRQVINGPLDAAVFALELRHEPLLHGDFFYHLAFLPGRKGTLQLGAVQSENSFLKIFVSADFNLPLSVLPLVEITRDICQDHSLEAI